MSDLTLPDARNERDQLAGRTDVLDRVGVLRTLPDGVHVSTPMIAEFYGVPVETVKNTVKRNREEFESDGYTVIARGEVGFKMNLTPADLGMPDTAPSLALFPRRAVLRVGMLLRDSETAREVRTYLLDAEHDAPARQLSEDEKLFEAFQILTRRNDALTEKNAALVEQIEHDRPAVEYVNTHVIVDDDVMLVKDWGRTYGLTEPQAFALLRDEKDLIYPKHFERWSEKKGCKVVETEYRPRAGKRSFTWFDVKEQRHAPRRNNGQARKTLYVKAIHAVDLARLVGLLPNLEVAS
ncbi:phage antirepressor KilAC domain-containing protein [Tsukamurella paurometabola]|uniref:Phage antirepressor protein KilAC domain n=1 Tax=Tsukamurella paurometabola TaxID=2061 RepID=A0A3P8MAQ9_TSUPA|nr:phage antirepressor KilAC domain-containing protein [Tsukamurella paurometabola]UEA84451.1 phage antirepressor KilAC domain-containing protein [Tsukamurella paurometabola]VDR37016.1 Phage antirepressor protein KilAC domain [Tsukamurella paurometabola]